MGSYSNWQLGVADETGQEVFAPSEATELVVHFGAELTDVCRRVVCQTSELGVIPNAFVGIQLGGVRGQTVSPKLWVERKVVPNQSRVVVDVDPVPDDVHRTPELSAQEGQELHDVLCPGVSVFLKQLEVQAQSLASWADRDRADGGDPIMAIPAFQDGSLSPRRERSPDQRSEHEAGFIEEN
jgi:hypothetical protein